MPFSRAAGASGNGTSTKSTVLGSPPSSLTTWETVMSPMLERLLTETFLPARSLGDLIGESCGTTTAPKSPSLFPEVVTPLATTFMLRPLSLATMSETKLEKAKS